MVDETVVQLGALLAPTSVVWRAASLGFRSVENSVANSEAPPAETWAAPLVVGKVEQRDDW